MVTMTREGMSLTATAITAQRYHDFSCGHRVVGHEGKCRWLHGHNYRVTFVCTALDLDEVGRVIDFGIMKSKLCVWLEENWDHRFLAWDQDPLMIGIERVFALGMEEKRGAAEMIATITDSIVRVPFNPTAENIAAHLLNAIGPKQLEGTGVALIKVIVEETRKCSAEASLYKPLYQVTE